MREKVDYMHIILRGGLLAMVCALLSVVWVNDPMLPAGELSGQWLYLAKVAMGAAVGWVVLAFLYYRKGYDMGADFYQVVIWSFIVLAASEAIYGFLFVWINGYDYGKGRIRIGWNGRDIMGPWQYCFLYSVCFLRE